MLNGRSFRRGGAEAYGSADAFDSVNPEKRDVVHVSGYTLVHHTADALLAFVKRTTEHREFTAVSTFSDDLGS